MGQYDDYVLRTIPFALSSLAATHVAVMIPGGKQDATNATDVWFASGVITSIHLSSDFAAPFTLRIFDQLVSNRIPRGGTRSEFHVAGLGGTPSFATSTTHDPWRNLASATLPANLQNYRLVWAASQLTTQDKNAPWIPEAVCPSGCLITLTNDSGATALAGGIVSVTMAEWIRGGARERKRSYRSVPGMVL